MKRIVVIGANSFQNPLILKAKEMGYDFYEEMKSQEELEKNIPRILEKKGMVFVEIKVAMDSRKDLGRPVETAEENKKEFMEYIAGNKKKGI